ncbi:dihydrolipoyl dehydrogenase [Litoribacillus peritrichatus]|uniref:Dihydrolipoyl dehydrogenase n=1 Tax=Litoribacillus peritrichatus TaxID=718191 RepID=A0ABP7ML11_9GAMM
MQPIRTIEKEVVVIGSGTAGLAAYRAAKQSTDSVVTVESGAYGTTCARVGCMPSKLLIAAAEAAHTIEHSNPFGVYSKGGVEISPEAVMDRVKSERDRFVGFVLEGVDNIPAEDKIQGRAKFKDSHTLSINLNEGGQLDVKAKRIVIATGSRPNIPEFFKQAKDRLVVNDDIFSWNTLPKAVAVFGPGVIGLELGQSMKRLGVEVHMFGAGGKVGPITDPVVHEYAEKTFAEEFYLDPKANVSSIQRVDDGVEIQFTDKQGNEQTILVNYLVAATGRRTNTDNLAIENAALDLDAFGVPVADPRTMQTSQSHIFIAGDVSNQLPLLHEAADQGKIAGDNAGAYPDIKPGLRRSPISVVFSDPQIMMVGSTYQQLAEQIKAGDVVTGDVSFENQGRSRVMLKNKGVLRIYAEKATGQLLGAEMIGPSAENIAHLLAWAHQQAMTIDQMLEMPFYHPVIEEGVRTALRDTASKITA